MAGVASRLLRVGFARRRLSLVKKGSSKVGIWPPFSIKLDDRDVISNRQILR
jgi:hypothetical protein